MYTRMNAEKNTDDISPEEIRSLYDDGIFLFCTGKYEEAIAYFDRIISINPDSMIAFGYKGLVLQKLMRHQEAIQCYEKVLLR